MAKHVNIIPDESSKLKLGASEEMGTLSSYLSWLEIEWIRQTIVEFTCFEY